MTVAIQSAAFKEGGRIPTKYTGDGSDISPPLSWSNLPPNVVELALIAEDPDAPGAFPFVHWVAYKIPPQSPGLEEGASRRPDGGALQGTNSFGRHGYRGPAPPPGSPHRYQFRLYALDHPLELPSGLDKKALLAAMEGHVLSEGVLTGTYQRAS